MKRLQLLDLPAKLLRQLSSLYMLVLRSLQCRLHALQVSVQCCCVLGHLIHFLCTQIQLRLMPLKVLGFLVLQALGMLQLQSFALVLSLCMGTVRTGQRLLQLANLALSPQQL